MIIKTVKPQLFAGVVKDVPAAHEELIDLIRQIRSIFDERGSNVWNVYHDLHLAAKTKSDLANNSDVLNLLREMEIRPSGDGKIRELLG
jgi:hypothetical protein